MFEGSSLAVVGNINRDVKTSPVRSGTHLLADGETSTAGITETIGGGGANSAFAAAALGARVAFAGKVGTDALAGRLERSMKGQGIRSHLCRDGVHPSGTSIALAFDNGHRHFVSCLPASESLVFEDIDLHVLDGARHLLRADVWFSEAMLNGGNEQLFKAAREKEVPVSLDLNWDPKWGQADGEVIARRKQAVREVLPLVTLAHGNARELMEFADAPDLQGALQRIAGWGVQAVVVHLGAQGAGWYEGGKFIVEPPVPARAQVHCTGTGDVLSVCMMLLHQRQDLPVVERLRLANGVVSRFMEGSLSLIPGVAD